MGDSNSSSDRDPIDRLAESFLTRFRAGERPGIDEYAARYPELAEEIREILPALVALEQNLAPEQTSNLGHSHTNRVADPTGAEPRLLGDYLILREVGRGGMGVVYEAMQQSLGRHVALKVLPAANLGGRGHLDRFRVEARAAARLHHTNVVPVFGVGEQDGLHYYAMQFIQGKSLDLIIDEMKRIQGSPTPERGGSGAAPGRRDALTQGITQSLLSGRFDGNAAPAPVEHESQAHTEPVGDQQLSAGNGRESRTAGETSRGFGSGSELSSAAGETTYGRSVARVGVQVAEALGHAHAEGILHRDIKPSNLMLDAKGTVWVTDFGLAKAEDSDGLTRTGDIVGTLRYMAPERFDGWSDPRSDVYALGVTLYELLTLKPLFDEPNRAKLIERVLHDTPVPPRRLDPRIPRDLETIVLKAIAREPERRYATAHLMAEDLQRFLADRPVLARRTTPVERFARWCRRNPALAGLTTAVALLLLTSVVVLSVSNARIRQASDRLRTANQQKDTALTEAKASAAESERQRGIAVDKEAAAIREEQRAWRRFYNAQIYLASQAWASGDVTRVVDLLETQRPRPGATDNRTFEWYYLWQLCHEGLRREIPLESGAYSLAVSGDGKTLALLTDRLEIIDLPSGHKRRRSLRPNPGWAIALSPDGRTLALAENGGVRFFDPDTLEETRFLPHPGWVRSLAFSPDGTELAAGSGSVFHAAAEGVIRLWNVSSGALKSTLTSHKETVMRLAYAPDGRTLASLSGWGRDEGSVTVWNLPAETVRFHQDKVGGRSLSFSPDGSRLAVGVGDNGADEDPLSVVILDLRTGEKLRVLKGHTGPLMDVVYSPDGRSVISTSSDRTIRVWDLATGTGRVAGTHNLEIRCLAQLRDGRSLLSVGLDPFVRVWDTSPLAPATPIPNLTDSVAIQFVNEGKSLLVTNGGNSRRFDAAKGEESESRPGGRVLAFSADGTLQAESSGEELLLRNRVDQTTVKLSHSNVAAVPLQNKALFSPDGKIVATWAPWKEGISLWDVSTGKFKSSWNVGSSIHSVAFSPDGQTLAYGFDFNRIGIWNLATDARLWRGIARGETRVGAITFSSDGRRIASGNFQGVIRVWDATSLELLADLSGYSQPITALAFSPDGQTLAAAGFDGMVRLWDPSNGQERLSLNFKAEALAFSPNGTHLAAANSETVTFFRASTSPVAADIVHRFNAYEQDSPDEKDGLGGVAWWSGRLDDAEKLYRINFNRNQNLHDRFPGNEEFLTDLAQSAFKLGLVLSEAGRNGDSRRYLELGDKAFAGLPDERRKEVTAALVFVGRNHRAKKRHESADRCYDLALRLRPNDTDILSARGQSWREPSEPAIADFSRAIALKPDDPDFWHERGEAHAKLGRWAEAALDFAEAARLHRARPEREEETTLHPWLDLASVGLARNDRAAYRETCRQLRAYLGNSTDLATSFWVALICTFGPDGIEDDSSVSEHLDRLRNLLPGVDFDVLNASGFVAYRQGQFHLASQLLGQAEGVHNPLAETITSVAATRLFLAMAKHRIGRVDEARQAFERARRVLDEPSSPNTAPGKHTWSGRVTLVHLRKEAADVLAGPASTGLAMERAALARELKRRPNDPASHNAYLQCCFDTGHWDLAAAEYDRWLNTLPPGHGFWEPRNPIEAEIVSREPLYEAYLAIRPDDLDIRIARGRHLAWLGRYADALKTYGSILRDTPQKDDNAPEYGCLLLLSGDTEGYRRWCAFVDRRLEGNLFRKSRTAIARSESPINANALIPWADEVLAKSPEPWLQYVASMVLIRTGNDTRAISEFEAIQKKKDPWFRELNWLGLAIAHAHLGQTVDARRCLSVPAKFLDASLNHSGDPIAHPRPFVALNDWVEFLVLYREAEGLILDAEFPADPFAASP